jgi:hypothetical protein
VPELLRVLSATSVNSTAPAKFETTSSAKSDIAFLTRLSLICQDDLIVRYRKAAIGTIPVAKATSPMPGGRSFNRIQPPEWPRKESGIQSIRVYAPSIYSRKVAYNQNPNKPKTPSQPTSLDHLGTAFFCCFDRSDR